MSPIFDGHVAQQRNFARVQVKTVIEVVNLVVGDLTGHQQPLVLQQTRGAVLGSWRTTLT